MVKGMEAIESKSHFFLASMSFSFSSEFMGLVDNKSGSCVRTSLTGTREVYAHGAAISIGISLR
ncbi:hypothetical protein GCM10010911_55100 [Paenibacillus nasutitermitis]|uniref:Uncharacterized protein n=1 Tax=Paenibacillus nasutitermitis TaxID=1652958 RepID=A0A916ZDQ2_9BACL|nr:hypothetical protein GCM10010911_55100 [Paenibacillus nasutitermitis]